MNIQHEKLLEALRFFSSRVQRPGAVKLLKLLFYLDLIHYRQTGRTVTALHYEPWKFGPVAPEVWRGLKEPSSDLQAYFDVTPAQRIDRDFSNVPEPPLGAAPSDMDAPSPLREPEFVTAPSNVRPKQPFQHRFLSQRELEIAGQLADIFFSAKAEEMSEASHNHRGPWDMARRSGANTIDLLSGELDIGDPERQLRPDEIRGLIDELVSPQA